MPALPERYDPSWFSSRIFESDEAFLATYEELRAVARFLVRGERYSPTLQATELVNQAFLKLCTSPITAKDREHFLAILSRYMRQILIDRARRKNAGKRLADHVPLESAPTIGGEQDPPWELVEEMLTRLRESNETLAKVFELHYFAAVPMAELATHLDRSERTVKRYWRAARAWMSDRVRARLAERMPS